MAASRTRKKAKQKKTNEQRARAEQARAEKIRQMLGPAMDAVPACLTCKSPRQEVERENIPAENWEKLEPLVAQMNEQGQTQRMFVHCSNCQEYAILGGWTSF